MKTYKLQQLASDNCVLDEKEFNTEEERENYIDDFILPNWEEGDSINFDGIRQLIFDCYAINRY